MRNDNNIIIMQINFLLEKNTPALQIVNLINKDLIVLVPQQGHQLDGDINQYGVKYNVFSSLSKQYQDVVMEYVRDQEIKFQDDFSKDFLSATDKQKLCYPAK